MKKFAVGDIVRIKTWEELSSRWRAADEDGDLRVGDGDLDDLFFIRSEMKRYCDSEFIITGVVPFSPDTAIYRLGYLDGEGTIDEETILNEFSFNTHMFDEIVDESLSKNVSWEELLNGGERD